MKTNRKRFKIIYDDECPFCVRSAALLRQLDRKGRFVFLKGSGPDARRLLKGQSFEDFNSMVVIYEGQWYRKGRAVRQIGRVLGLGWAADLLPLAILDFIYQFIVNRRFVFSKLLFATQKCSCSKR
ncbi:thiol-disulfide oxidoreductase DCC family protein [Calditrichota bacterium GD2]